VPASSLAVEITERMLIDDPCRAADTLRALRDLGLQVSIDDFGTGYNSLAHLKHLPVDELKIDRGFVANLATDERDAGIVAATVALGRVLGLTVVAEGVEDETALTRLADLGCHAAQGYHLGRPVPAAALADLAPEVRAERLAA
jgi:EAL domain-containing protein (putative c-di-GMP-specific phosphodiesterase class I)